MRFLSSRKLGLVFLFSLVLLSVDAQQNPEILSAKRTVDGRYTFLKFKAPNSGQRRNDTSATGIRSILGLNNRNNLAPVSRIIAPKDAAQTRHTKYQQFFSGIPVEHATIVAHSNNGNLELVSGEYYLVPENLNIAPSLNEAAALDKAVQFIGASRYSWEDRNFPERKLNDRPRGELLICRDYIADRTNRSSVPTLRLAYKFEIYSTQPLRHEYVYVDASSGRILLNDPIIKHVDGIGETRYSGSRTISTTQKPAGNFSLRDTTANYNVVTWNMNKGTAYINATEFLDNDNNWTAAEYNNSNFDNAALDAHWGAMKTVEYFRTKHNRNSFDNLGGRINSYVHYANGYANAFWDGYYMTYGDGNGATNFPFTSVDIVGHEIGHAVCQYSAGLIYGYESGALNESLSDIWGACIEHFSAPEKNTWLLADEISSTGNPIRSMINPKSHGQPDTYLGINWYTGTGDNGGVHYNSGVMNHWFYILSEGKSGVNDHGRAYNVSAIGLEKAAAIVYRAETMYLFPNAGYIDARLATIQAAEDLYNSNSTEYNQVVAAWDAVGVYDALVVPANLTASLNAASNIQLSWTFYSPQNIDGFVIERAANESNVYLPIVTLPKTARSFIDSFYVPNAINKYRIKSVRDTASSAYSNLAYMPVGNAPFVMINGTYMLCDRLFLDPGGFEKYNDQITVITTIRPTMPDGKVRITFSKFRVETSDALYVYNGPNTGYPLLAILRGNTVPSALESTAITGELTFGFVSNSSANDSGWVAYLSCFIPLGKPTNLTAQLNAQSQASLQWLDNISDETGFVVQRSLNDSTNFVNYASLPAGTSTYLDTQVPDNSITFYRVRTIRGTDTSQASNSAFVSRGNFGVVMQNGTFNTCNTVMLDPGGLGNYGNNQNLIMTFVPAEAGKKLKAIFSSFALESCCDYVRVYNGPNTSSPLLGSFNGSAIPPHMISTAPGGELTFQFSSDGSVTAAGWQVNINCYKPVATPTLLNATLNGTSVDLNWVDNADDETKYVVERSANSQIKYTAIAELPANSTSYTDINPPNNSQLLYRVSAFRNTDSSLKSNVAGLEMGNGPIMMKDTTVITCDKVFMDPGGVDSFPATNNSITTTFKPAQAGYRVKILFSKFRINWAYLYVYNGSSVNSPLIGSFILSQIPPALEGINAEGSLTFRFVNYQYSDSGWVANVTCVKTVARPSGVSVSLNSSQLPNITWTDNADDETKYVIERSINGLTYFQQIAELPANSNSFVDVQAPVDNHLHYRIKAVRETVQSFYSDTAKFSFGNAPFMMKDTTLVTCDKIFMDAAGADITPAIAGTATAIIVPAIAGNRIKVNFNQVRIAGSLRVYNGNSTAAPLIGTYYGVTTIPVLDGNGPTGALTFVYDNPGYSDSGWVAKITCYKPVAKPTGLLVTEEPSQKPKLTWTDNADDEIKYLIERSTNSPTLYQLIAELPANSTSFIDSSAAYNSLLNYRIRAARDTFVSFYSDTVSIALGNAPFLLIKDSTLFTCDKIFMDAGGVDKYAPSTVGKVVTFKPSQAGYRVRVVFSQLKLTFAYLAVYNGSSTSSPQIGSFTTFASMFPFEGTGPDGSLTFLFSGTNYSDSGWIAQVTCYKIVVKPSSVQAHNFNEERIDVSWQDNSDDETKFVIERAVNGSPAFTKAGEVSSNNTSFVDSFAPADSWLAYRVRAFRDTIPSFYSDTSAMVSNGNYPILLQNSHTVTTCGRIFMDGGGDDVCPQSNTLKVATFFPGLPGHKIKVTFLKLNLISGPQLRVWNGSSQTNPLGEFQTLPPGTIHSTAADGALTFSLAGSSRSDSGWVAYISCYKPVAQPGNLSAFVDGQGKIQVSWIDSADDEKKYVIERSVNAPSLFTQLAELPENTTSFLDSTVPNNSVAFYRVRAYRDSVGSLYSGIARVEFGNAPVLHGGGPWITCDKVYMDPGGVDRYLFGFGTVVFKPAIPGNKIRITFSKLSLFNGNIRVYDGPDFGSPLIRTISGSNIPTPIEATNSEGILTLLLNSSVGYDSGWVARVVCAGPMLAPTNLTGTITSSKQIALNWNDINNSETGVTIERSIGESNNYVQIATLPENSTGFTDTNAVINETIYYRVIAFNELRSSPYTSPINIRILNCGDPILLADKSSLAKMFINWPSTTLTDTICKYFATVLPNGILAIAGITKTQLWVDNNLPTGLGLTAVNRHFDILPNFSPLAVTGTVKLYFTQAEFDQYNNLTPFAKLPTNASDLSGIRNLRLFICKGGSSNNSGSINTYAGLPEELDTTLVQTTWNASLGVWEVTASLTGFGGLFVSSRNDSMYVCPVAAGSPDLTLIRSNIYGSSYQWQKFNGSAFVNLSNDTNHSGTQTYLLQVKSGSLKNGDKFRCLVNGIQGRTFVINRYNRWLGTNGTNWSDPQNWSCGAVPGVDADIVVESGKLNYPIINANVSCRSLTVMSGASVQVLTGFNVTITK